MEDKIFQMIHATAQIPLEEWESFKKGAILKTIKAADYLYQVGQECDNVWFVKEGLLKAIYHADDGKEYVRSFIQTGDIIATPYFEMQGETYSRSSIKAIEDTEVLEFSYNHLKHYVDTSRYWNNLYMFYLQKYYFHKEDREFELIALSAAERYEKFKQKFGQVSHKMTKSDIAAYLGITNSSFSRLLGKSCK